MAPEWIYLLKVNVGIALFYAFYRLSCCKDTFFQWRRTALLSFLVISFLYPLLNIQHWVQEQPSINELAGYYATWLTMDEVMVSDVSTAMRTPDLMTIFGYLYIIGIGVLSVRFLFQLLSIFRLVWRGKKTTLDGVRVISLAEPANPFSFFGWIFVYLPDMKDESRQEILMHELTHVRQYHSIDVVVSEIINIICWMNPFMWLLKAEIRLNLEYLADNKVAEGICNTKQYQYHLLGLANQNRQIGLYNHFNVSHLKNRIVMMNKKRTRTTGRIKYALFAPLAFALLLVSNIESVARTTGRIAKDVVTNLTDAVDQQEPVFQVVEQMPEFPGGMAECHKWLGENIKYPKEAQDKKEQGRVIVQFVVEKDGSITEVKVARRISPSLDAEALRVISSMPKWKPGVQRGQAVRVKYTMPIAFGLDKKGPVINVSKEEPKPDANGVYQVVEKMPEFPGGMSELMKWLKEHVKYPKEAQEKKEHGRVIVMFTVQKDGSIAEAKVVRGISSSLDVEALRVIKLMPNWQPAMVKGEPVACKFTVPVVFVLDKNNEEVKAK